MHMHLSPRMVPILGTLRVGIYAWALALLVQTAQAMLEPLIVGRVTKIPTFFHHG